MSVRPSLARGGALLVIGLCALASHGLQAANPVDPARGVDASVDYAALVQIGPWDDRNYQLTAEDIALLSPDESSARDPVPAFFRVELRRSNPGLRKAGPAQYPRSALQRFLALPKVDVLFASETTTVHYAEVFAQLREQGTPVPTNDMWIAALVQEHRLTLYSRDEHFRHLPQLDWMR